MSKNLNKIISIDISESEAVVFFDWLVRLNENEPSDLFVDQAEKRVLYDLESFLEAKLSVVLESDYATLLSCARDSVRDEAEQ